MNVFRSPIRESLVLRVGLGLASLGWGIENLLELYRFAHGPFASGINKGVWGTLGGSQMLVGFCLLLAITPEWQRAWWPLWRC
ncbi:MAG: hypothetical protein R3B95_12195 [Nitrospirales bacterium]|nr:hypothetical protein [Nitrospirales bacterium]